MLGRCTYHASSCVIMCYHASSRILQYSCTRTSTHTYASDSLHTHMHIHTTHSIRPHYHTHPSQHPPTTLPIQHRVNTPWAFHHASIVIPQCLLKLSLPTACITSITQCLAHHLCCPWCITGAIAIDEGGEEGLLFLVGVVIEGG